MAPNPNPGVPPLPPDITPPDPAPLPSPIEIPPPEQSPPVNDPPQTPPQPLRMFALAASRTLCAAALVLAITAAPAMAATDQQALLARARTTVSDLKRDKAFGTARDLMHQARAVLIVPRLYKAGFFVGGEGGSGVLLLREGSGGWSPPAFYTIGSASFGLQIGAEQAEMVLFVMSQRALDALLKNQVKLGVEAGLTVVTLGSNVEGATTTAAGADIVTWASSSGAYAGISLNGSVVAPATSDNTAYYGRATTPEQVLKRGTTADPGSAALRQDLNGVR